MTFLVDTDWIVDLLRDQASARAFVAQRTPDELAVSLISIGELREGAFGSPDPDHAEHVIMTAIRPLTILTLDLETVRIFGKIRADLRRRGQLIGNADLLIAATALRHDLTLVTRNRRHFDRVPGLNVIP